MNSLVRVTPFPNVLIDTFMPLLKDTEWRLLCIIVRQTLGWHQRNGAYKAEDWLTQSQLKQRSGRNSAAVSAAIDSLARQGLIRVCSASHQPLHSPCARRAYRGRLYFGLSRQILSIIENHTTRARAQGSFRMRSDSSDMYGKVKLEKQI